MRHVRCGRFESSFGRGLALVAILGVCLGGGVVGGRRGAAGADDARPAVPVPQMPVPQASVPQAPVPAMPAPSMPAPPAPLAPGATPEPAPVPGGRGAEGVPTPRPEAGPAAPAAPSVPATSPVGPRLTLSQAVAQGLVVVAGERPGSYQSVDLVLTSKSDAPLLLDLSGSHLQPTTGNVQRLGLSHPVTPRDPPPDGRAPEGGRAPDAPPGTWPFVLAPRAQARVRMNTCCMDSGRPAPRGTDRFELAAAKTPRAVEAALRWWVDHPDAPQGFVNSAIWQNDVSLLEQAYARNGSGAPSAPVAPKGRKVRSHGGIVYRLNDGVLTSVDAEGVNRFHATWIWDVLPRGDALYAVGQRGASNELWRFAATGEPPWGRVLTLGSGVTLGVMIPAGGGAYLVREGTGPLVVSRTQGEATTGEQVATYTLDRMSVGPVDPAKGRYVVVTWQKGTPKPGVETVGPANANPASSKYTVFDLDVRTGKLDARKTFWNVREMAAGPGGVFALSPVGLPERLEGEKLRKLPSAEEYASIVLVGKTHLVLRDKAGGLVGLDVETGRTSPLPPEASLPAADVLSIDPVTDDVVWVGAHDDLRWRFGAAAAEVIP